MKMKKLTASLLLAACTFACACGSDKGGDNGPAAGGIIVESNDTKTYVEGTLHNVNVNFTTPVSSFVTNGQTNYKIVIQNTTTGNGATTGKAAGFIAEHVNKAADTSIETIELTDDLEITENTQYIFVGCEDKFKTVGGEMPAYPEIGIAGYQIKNYGKNVFINAYSLHGYQLGAISFLREVLGYDMFSEDCVIYENDGKWMPEMDIVERPDFDYRTPNGGSVAQGEVFGMGYTYIAPTFDTGESWCHNIYDFVSKEEVEAGKLPREWLSNDDTMWQMCYTARGNKELFTGLVNHIADRLYELLWNRVDCNTIILGQHDIGGNTPMVQNCKCDACKASYDYYGTMGGAWLSLCNRASVLVDEKLKTEEAQEHFGGIKDWNLLQLVYHTQVNAPCEKNNNGYIWDESGRGIPKIEKWFNTDGSVEDWDTAWAGTSEENTESNVLKAWSDTHERIYTAPNVHYMYATSASDWTYAYYDTPNASWSNIARAWSGVGGEFFVWAYALNSEFILYPYNSFDTSFETTRYFKNLGAKYMFWQGQYQNPNNAGFTKLRNYLDSKVEFDVNIDYQTYVDKFFKYYFGEASELMQRFFEEAQAQCRWIEKVNSVNGNIHNKKLGDAENWPEGLINSWIDLINEAYDLIEEKYKVTDPEQYEIYKKHIMIEEQFPVYVLCTTYASSFKASDLKAMRKEFLNDFYSLKNTIHAESRLMTLVTDAWDLD